MLRRKPSKLLAFGIQTKGTIRQHSDEGQHATAIPSSELDALLCIYQLCSIEQ